ncbi:MAG: FKBP-type peptidyl-prolyl cis-trans isomerase [Tannerella sp.]|jgi:FKBP-type peptidyl-prolyl cis-trans isomerase FklB|nr:FKBP-type peptidyl-prolyl cis-trans isomerase [Tannerella sp.]
MKRVSILVLIVAGGCYFGSCNMFHKPGLKTELDTMSYFFGMARAEGARDYLTMQAGIDTAYMDAFYEGFKAGSKKYSPKDVAYLEGMRIAQMANNQWIKNLNRDIFLGDSGKSVNRMAVLSGFYNGIKNPEDMKIMRAETYSRTMIEKIKEEYKLQKYAASIAENKKFLEDNKSKEGVVTTSSGLQYKILVEGNGAIPENNSTVSVNYRGTLIDGTEFDSSYKNNAPSQFRCNQVIPGWTEALSIMPVGSKWELYIPQELAYGSVEQRNIPPYSTLIFEIELVDIVQDKK